MNLSSGTSTVWKCVLSLVAVLFLQNVLAQPEILSDSDIVLLTFAKVDTAIINAKIHATSCSFDLRSPSLIHLTQANVLPGVVKEMISKSSKINTSTNPAATLRATEFTIDSVWNHFRKHNDPLKYSIDDYLVVHFKENIDSLIRFKYDSILLWIDSIPFPDLKIWRSNSCSNSLIFHLLRDTADNSSWNYLYSFSNRGCFKAYKDVSVQIGTYKSCIASGTKRIHLYIRECWMMIVGYLFIVALICFAYWLVKQEYILRDTSMVEDTVQLVKKYSDPPNPNEVLKQDLPFSVSKTQLLFWTFLVSIGFVFIWLNTDDLAAITTSTALLLGISGGTSVLSKLIENKPAPRLSAAQFKEIPRTQNFFKDILSSDIGFSPARVQMVTFTAFIGFYFGWYVVYYLKLPDFSQGILLLLGVSNLTYAGIKLSE
jgi:hypothetical protein